MNLFIINAFLFLQTVLPGISFEQYDITIVNYPDQWWYGRAFCGTNRIKVNELMLRRQYQDDQRLAFAVVGLMAHEIGHLRAGRDCDYETPARDMEVLALQAVRAPADMIATARFFQCIARRYEGLPQRFKYARLSVNSAWVCGG